MADREQDRTWPLAQFYFKVRIAGREAAFKEVSGLVLKDQAVEYRHDDAPGFSTIKMPGIIKTSNVILKNGLFKNSNDFWDWFNRCKINAIRREEIAIYLLDQDNNTSMVWLLKNAWPKKIAGISLQPNGDEVTVETIELVHEGIVGY